MDNIRVEDIREYMSTSHEGGGGNSVYFTPHVDNSGNLSWTNNGNLLNPETVNIKGAKGDKGDTGAQGPQGKQGLKGDTGEDGDAGVITNVTASVDNNVGTPSVQVTLGGTPNQRTIDLAFHNLKGSTGSGGSGGTDYSEEIAALQEKTSLITSVAYNTMYVNGAIASTGNITAGQFNGALNGNAKTATKATQDNQGNVLLNDYVRFINDIAPVNGKITLNIPSTDNFVTNTSLTNTLNNYATKADIPDTSDFVQQSDVANAANKIPKFSTEGHLVLPSGAEIW